MTIKAGHVLAASAVLFFCGFAFADDGVTLALNTQARPAAVNTAALAPAATAQVQADGACLEGCDFDALSEVNDPLFREGSRQLLEQAAKDDDAKADAKAPPVLRDAPNSAPVQGRAKTAAPAAKETPAVKAAPAAEGVQAPHPAIKKPAVKDQGPADPVKGSNLL